MNKTVNKVMSRISLIGMATIVCMCLAAVVGMNFTITFILIPLIGVLGLAIVNIEYYFPPKKK